MRESEKERGRERDALFTSVIQWRACALVLNVTLADSSLSRLVSRLEEEAAGFSTVPLSLLLSLSLSSHQIYFASFDLTFT